MVYTLGIAPESLTVNLYAGAPFNAALKGDWSAGTVVELRFKGGTPTTWQTTVIAGVATFAVASTLVNARSNAERVELWVGGAAWAAGTVVLRGT